MKKEQIFLLNPKRTAIMQYNPKQPKKQGFKNLVRAGASGIMYDFCLYAGKEKEEQSGEEKKFPNCAQVVSRVCQDLPADKGQKVFFDNQFASLDLFLFLKSKGLLAVGFVRSNRVNNCPLALNKDLEKQERCGHGYRTYQNSGQIVVTWVDNKFFLIASNMLEQR